MITYTIKFLGLCSDGSGFISSCRPVKDSETLEDMSSLSEYTQRHILSSSDFQEIADLSSDDLLNWARARVIRDNHLIQHYWEKEINRKIPDSFVVAQQSIGREFYEVTPDEVQP